MTAPCAPDLTLSPNTAGGGRARGVGGRAGVLGGLSRGEAAPQTGRQQGAAETVKALFQIAMIKLMTRRIARYRDFLVRF